MQNIPKKILKRHVINVEAEKTQQAYAKRNIWDCYF